MDLISSPVDGISLAFELSGSGPLTVVFIHGLVGDHTDFSSQIDHFSPTHRIVGVDLAGAGSSGRTRSAWTMESFGEDVAAVVDHLGLDSVVLVGHSLGGNVTVEAALRLSDRVKGLVWVSSFRSLDSVQSASQVEEWFAPFNVDFAAAMDDLSRRNFGPNADPALVDVVTRKARVTDQARAIGLLRSKFNHLQVVVERLLDLEAPIFAINPDFKPNDGASFTRHGVDLRIVAGVGHFVMMEDPGAFNTDSPTSSKHSASRINRRLPHRLRFR